MRPMHLLAWVWVGVACDSGGAGSSARQATADAQVADARSTDARPSDAAPPDAAPPDALLDAAVPDMAVDLGPPPTLAECFAAVGGGLGPNYAPFNPVLGHHCKGTNHQTIEGVEKVVFLGDSVTYGTPPTLIPNQYRSLVTAGLKERFGPDIEVSSCARLGARTDDFLSEDGEIPRCFPEGGSPKRTLVIFTMGGNDIAAWASDAETPERALELADLAADDLEAAIAWLKDPARFPHGVYVIFANPYEFTDATGDLDSCELARVAGFSGNWIEGAGAVIHFNERYMQTAVAHHVDMIFTLEAFCGHGFHNEDPASQCYQGPGTERWFDLTCIHPNDLGHRVIADMFLAVVDE